MKGNYRALFHQTELHFYQKYKIEDHSSLSLAQKAILAKIAPCRSLSRKVAAQF
ncbi:hypothetical protein J2Z65_005556 [Paenibacillus aceris]|uniref:Uncharacterized protein n=1 Tax=Paenibacillus aceris TaxID=869555 RepID=A0ABS4I5V6_9BACL|nr:hypothetical protein [Paenibacillus aceris]